MAMLGEAEAAAEEEEEEEEEVSGTKSSDLAVLAMSVTMHTPAQAVSGLELVSTPTRGASCECCEAGVPTSLAAAIENGTPRLPKPTKMGKRESSRVVGASAFPLGSNRGA